MLTAKVEVAKDLPTWVGSINCEALVYVLGQQAITKLRTKLDVRTGNYLVQEFAHSLFSYLIPELRATIKGGIHAFEEKLNPLIMYTLGLVKHNVLCEGVHASIGGYIMSSGSKRRAGQGELPSVPVFGAGVRADDIPVLPAAIPAPHNP